MTNKPKKHSARTESLARALKPKDIFTWLVSYGYFPESYILPPCFHVTKHPKYGKTFFPLSKRKKFKPKISQICDLHFPKSDFTDRTFGIIDPEIHNDIAYEIANNWNTIIDLLFKKDKLVYSYSFPIPLSSKTPGQLGKLRAGRLIYEWIGMAENDLAEEAYKFKYLVKTDIKNFYPSIYTHSIAWAIHTKATLRSGKRYDYALLGNRLDKLFQNANDGCTNGIPVGPVVSDLIAEIILSAVDYKISYILKKKKILCVRFKDDYRFLCKDEEACRDAIKSLQRELKQYSLLLNEEKTEKSDLPEGIFRKWRSKYQAIKPKKKRRLSFEEFKEFYLEVLRIDKEEPGTGIVDRFLADLIDNNYKPLLPISEKHIQKSISLLLLLAERRVKAFPKILALLESMISVYSSTNFRKSIEKHLKGYLKDLSQNVEDNRYLIAWILYFLKSNKMGIKTKLVLKDRILKTINLNRDLVFKKCKNFKIYRSIGSSKKSGSLLRYLDTFKPQ